MVSFHGCIYSFERIRQDEYANASVCASLSAACTTGKAMLLQALHSIHADMSATTATSPLLLTCCKMLLTHTKHHSANGHCLPNKTPQDVALHCLVKCKSMTHDSTAIGNLAYSHVPCFSLSMMSSRSSTWCTSRSRMAAMSLTLLLCRLLGHHRQ